MNPEQYQASPSRSPNEAAIGCCWVLRISRRDARGVEFLENKPIVAGAGPEWLFNIDTLTKLLNYVPVVAGINSNGFTDDLKMHGLETIVTYDDSEEEADFINLESSIHVSPTTTARLYKNHPLKQVIGIRILGLKVCVFKQIPEFLENKPIVAGAGPEWLFNIDTLTKLLNYVPVVAGINSNGFTGTKDSIGVGQSSMETGSTQDYIFMPLWKDGSPLFDYSLKISGDAGKKHAKVSDIESGA
nr:hypothetical protein [Tanacetum cinerariifolium]